MKIFESSHFKAGPDSRCLGIQVGSHSQVILRVHTLGALEWTNGVGLGEIRLKSVAKKRSEWNPTRIEHFFKSAIDPELADQIDLIAKTQMEAIGDDRVSFENESIFHNRKYHLIIRILVEILG